ncbi:MAG TPA: transporter substrate-binding domain-containing protein [Albitalea sp.]|nr:transporter substrate-binding domain-containing protein [Albitalea sp.]HJW11911.1 transporter substrate-binding domain-containing protein [Albitalea sp.]
MTLVVGGAAGAAGTPLAIVTDDNHPPYAYRIDGKPVGIYVEIMRRIFEAMPEYEITITTAPWKRALYMAERGEVDAIFPPHYFAGQRPYLSKFSDPVFEEVPVVMCGSAALKAAGVKGGSRWPADFTALSFGASAGVRMGGDAFWAEVAAGRIRVEEAAGVRENLKKLLHGRIDCYISDRLTIAMVLAHLGATEPMPRAAQLEEAAAMPVEHGYLAFSRQAAMAPAMQDEFLRKFNRRLAALKTSGELKTIVERYLRGFNPALVN